MADNLLTPDAIVPDFSTAMTGGKTFQLSDYKGKNVLLFFYPKDNTPGCTSENIAFRDAHAEFLAANTVIFGLSRDSIRSHENFKAKLELPFELIADPDEIVCKLFQTIKLKNMYGKQIYGIERSTFFIDATGKLVKEWRGIRVANHVDDVLNFVKNF
jgi:peroxiredoxin Q/BCP